MAPFWRRREERSYDGPSYNLGDPALAEYLGLAGRNDAGVSVNESSALGFTAVWRAVSIVSGTIAGLPLKTYRRDDQGNRVQVPSVFDNPGGRFFTPFEFKELVLVHLLLHGNAYLLHVYTEAGTLDSFFPLHPSMVSVRYVKDAGFLYDVTADGTSKTYTADDLTHIRGMSTEGLKGLSPIAVARNAIGTGIAGDKAAARMFSSGMLIGGLVTPDESLTEEQATEAITGLKSKLTGTANAGDLVLINASLKVQPWTMTAEDGQFIQTRVHQIEEIARIFGVPPHLLGQTEKQTSWGTGVQEQNRGLARYTLAPWTSRIEERFSQLLAQPRFVEFDYSGLLQAAPEIEIPLLIQQVQAGLLTIDEARKIRNLPPIETPSSPEQPPAEPVPTAPEGEAA